VKLQHALQIRAHADDAEPGFRTRINHEGATKHEPRRLKGRHSCALVFIRGSAEMLAGLEIQQTFHHPCRLMRP